MFTLLEICLFPADFAAKKGISKGLPADLVNKKNYLRIWSFQKNL
jgi:hypothetical protein